MQGQMFCKTLCNKDGCRDVWDVWLKAKTTKECQVSIEDLIPGSRCIQNFPPCFVFSDLAFKFFAILGTSSESRLRMRMASVTKARSPIRSM